MHKKNRIVYFFLLMGINCFSAEQNSSWTWLHRKYFSNEEQEQNKIKKAIICAKNNLPHFNQLIFSWNALRPKKGYFTFYAQIKNAKTQKWGKWHRMISWGNNIQKSYKTNPDQLSSYHHVRLESAIDSKADAFAIKVESEEGADLALLKSFAVNLSNFSNFKSELEQNLASLSTVYIQGVPQFSQFELDHPRNDGFCSPTSCAMLISYLMSKRIDPVKFAEKSHDTGLDKYGSWPFNMAHAFEHSQGKISFAVTRFNSFKNLYAHLSKGIPVVISVRGYIQGAPKVYNNGHLLLVIGYDAKTKDVICHDPAVSDAKIVKKRYPLKSFLSAWERSHRLAYLAHPLT